MDELLAAPKRKKLNIEERRELRAVAMQLFAKKYARKAQPGRDPNDRKYDRKVEQEMKHMEPEELHRLLHHGEDD